MHLAICDDNMADRKQLERLLDRESDRRKEEQGLLYIDSYGNPDALLTHPMQYDAFFIDMCHTPGVSGLQVAAALTEQGVTVPFIMCSSDTDYTKQDIPGHVLHLQKPIKVADLQSILDQAQELADHAEKLIELREDWASHYVKEADILYAVGIGNHTTVTLRSGEVYRIFGAPSLLFDFMEKEHPTFVMPSAGVILNCRHIREIRFPMRAVMSDGHTFLLHPRILPYVRKIMNECEKP